MIDFLEAIIAGTPTAKVYGPEGGEITGLAPAVSVNGSEVTTVIEWTEATFADRLGYMLELSIEVGSTTHIRKVLFAVAPRVFASEVCDFDITSLYPSIAGTIPLAADGGMAAWRRAAWQELSSEVAAQIGDYRTWRVMDASVFRRAHIEATMWFWYAQEARDAGPDSEDWNKAGYHQKQYRRALATALTRATVDKNDDDLVDESEAEQIQPVRWHT